jgi:hypothetical protein
MLAFPIDFGTAARFEPTGSAKAANGKRGDADYPASVASTYADKKGPP